MNENINFNFDLMKDLAINNPAEFIALRSVMLEKLINSLANPADGKLMQERIDIERLNNSPGLKSYSAMLAEINERADAIFLLADKLCSLGN